MHCMEIEMIEEEMMEGEIGNLDRQFRFIGNYFGEPITAPSVREIAQIGKAWINIDYYNLGFSNPGK